MRKTQDASQLVVGWAKAIADHHKRCWRFTCAIENGARHFFDAIGSGQPDGP
jgi:hypothetical protein